MPFSLYSVIKSEFHHGVLLHFEHFELTAPFESFLHASCHQLGCILNSSNGFDVSPRDCNLGVHFYLGYVSRPIMCLWSGSVMSCDTLYSPTGTNPRGCQRIVDDLPLDYKWVYYSNWEVALFLLWESLVVPDPLALMLELIQKI